MLVLALINVLVFLHSFFLTMNCFVCWYHYKHIFCRKKTALTSQVSLPTRFKSYIFYKEACCPKSRCDCTIIDNFIQFKIAIPQFGHLKSVGSNSEPSRNHVTKQQALLLKCDFPPESNSTFHLIEIMRDLNDKLCDMLVCILKKSCLQMELMNCKYSFS